MDRTIPIFPQWFKNTTNFSLIVDICSFNTYTHTYNYYLPEMLSEIFANNYQERL